MTKPVEVAQKYMESFFGQTPLESMETLLSEDLTFEGPFHHSTSAKAYLEALRADPPQDVSFEMEEVFEKEQSVCFVYQFSKPGVKTRMVETFEIYGGKIHKIKLIFDTEAFT